MPQANAALQQPDCHLEKPDESSLLDAPKGQADGTETRGVFAGSCSHADKRVHIEEHPVSTTQEAQQATPGESGAASPFTPHHLIPLPLLQHADCGEKSGDASSAAKDAAAALFDSQLLRQAGAGRPSPPDTLTQAALEDVSELVVAGAGLDAVNGIYRASDTLEPGTAKVWHMQGASNKIILLQPSPGEPWCCLLCDSGALRSCHRCNHVHVTACLLQARVSAIIVSPISPIPSSLSHVTPFLILQAREVLLAADTHRRHPAGRDTQGNPSAQPLVFYSWTWGTSGSTRQGRTEQWGFDPPPTLRLDATATAPQSSTMTWPQSSTNADCTRSLGLGPTRAFSPSFKVTEEQLRRVFDELDINADGRVSHAQFIKGLRQNPKLEATLGWTTNGIHEQESAGRDEYVRRFNDMDADASKTITLDEMLDYYRPWLNSTSNPEDVTAQRISPSSLSFLAAGAAGPIEAGSSRVCHSMEASKSKSKSNSNRNREGCENCKRSSEQASGQAFMSVQEQLALQEDKNFDESQILRPVSSACSGAMLAVMPAGQTRKTTTWSPNSQSPPTIAADEGDEVCSDEGGETETEQWLELLCDRTLVRMAVGKVNAAFVFENK